MHTDTDLLKLLITALLLPNNQYFPINTGINQHVVELDNGPKEQKAEEDSSSALYQLEFNCQSFIDMCATWRILQTLVV